MASVIFSNCVRDALRGAINFDDDKFRVMLVSAGYKPDRAKHSRKSDAAAFEVKSDGYVAGGRDATAKLSLNGNLISIALGAAGWDSVSVNARGAVYYKTARAGDIELREELVAYIDFGRDIVSTDGAFDVTASEIMVQN